MRAAEIVNMSRHVHSVTNILISEKEHFRIFLFWSSNFINDLQTKYIQGVHFFCSIL